MKIADVAAYNHIVLSSLKESEGLESIASVLKKPEQYLSGEKKLTDKQIVKIRNKGAELRARIDMKADSEYRTKIKKWIQNDTLDDSLETLFHRAPGRNWDIGEEIILQGKSYTVSHKITNALGLKMVIFVPKEPGAKPIVACNGTKNFQNFLDDLHNVIGLRSIQASHAEIENAINEVVQKYGPVKIGGHSLGGAISQTITAMFCDKTHNNKSIIAECHYYNAPGCGKLIHKLYLRKAAELKHLGIDPPEIRSYRNVDDIIPRFGGPHLPPDRSVLASDPRFKFSIKMLISAHRTLGFFSNKLLKVVHLSDDKPSSKTLESLRKKVSSISLPILVRIAGKDNLQNRINLIKDYFQRNQDVSYHRA